MAKKLGLDAFPTYFIIDRKRILRTIDARQDLEALVSRIIAERP